MFASPKERAESGHAKLCFCLCGHKHLNVGLADYDFDSERG